MKQGGTPNDRTNKRHLPCGGAELVTGNLKYSPKNGVTFYYTDGKTYHEISQAGNINITKNTLLIAWFNLGTESPILSGNIQEVGREGSSGLGAVIYYVTGDFEIE